MRYLDSLRFLFGTPNWLTNLLLMTLCLIIPVVGPIVLIGYLLEVFDSARSKPEPSGYPDFDFNRFVPYLTRGIWVFLVQLLVQVFIGLPMAFILGFGTALVAALDEGRVTVFALLVLLPLGLILSIVLGMVLWAVTIFEGIRRGLDISGMLSFVREYLGKVWRETLGAILFLVVAGWVLSLAGLALCCVGVYPVTSWLMFANYHLMAQTYRLYLERGGTPPPEQEMGRPTRAPEPTFGPS
ncbi:MAG: DUF4013 domain-containing protein [Gemmataceae bacterium]|nr:DUF4013 domain-containing protein [Gemmataceae bacterium]